MLPTKLGVSATLFQFWVLYDFNAVLPTVPAKTLDWCENALSSFLFKDLHIFAVLELVFDIFVWSLHPCNLPSHHGMIDKWPKYSGHFLPNSSTANTKITVTQRHPNQEYSFKTRKNFFLGPHHNKTEKKTFFAAAYKFSKSKNWSSTV